MSLLDRKLLRDLRALKSQAIAVALVMACGLAMMTMTRSLILSLERTRDSYYEEHRFADVFARVKRAPNAVREQLAAIPGVAAVQTGIAVQVTLDLPGLPEPAVGLLNSLPERGEPVLNRLYVRSGRLRLLAVTSPKRLSMFPDAPTLEELGLKGFDAGTTHGFWAPAGTPAAIIERMNREINRALMLPAAVEAIRGIGAEPTPMSPAEFGALTKADARRFAQIIKDRNIVHD